MNNFERYKDAKALESVKFGVVKGEPMQCDDIQSCTDCDFCTKICAEAKMAWLKAEYEEPRINLPKDLPVNACIEVSNLGDEWERAHFECFFRDMVSAFDDGRTSFTEHGSSLWTRARLPKEETDDKKAVD